MGCQEGQEEARRWAARGCRESFWKGFGQDAWGSRLCAVLYLGAGQLDRPQLCSQHGVWEACRCFDAQRLRPHIPDFKGWPYPLAFQSLSIELRALNTPWAGGGESYTWFPDIRWALLASKKQAWGKAVVRAFLPHQQQQQNKQKVKRIWHLEKEKGMWKQTPTLRFGPGYCNIRASASMSPSSATSDLYGSNAHAVVTGGKLLSSALPFLLLSVCPDGHPLNQLSHLIYMRDGCIWIL